MRIIVKKIVDVNLESDMVAKENFNKFNDNDKPNKMLLTKEDLTSIKEDISSVKKDTTSIKKDMRGVKSDVVSIKEGIYSIKEDIKTLKVNVNSKFQHQQRILEDIQKHVNPYNDPNE